MIMMWGNIAPVWVALISREEQKQGKMDWYTNMLGKFERRTSLCTWDIVIGGNVGIPVWLWDESTVSSEGLPRWEPIFEIQKKKKGFQTNSGMFLCKVLSCTTTPPSDRLMVRTDWCFNHLFFPESFKQRRGIGICSLLLHYGYASLCITAAILDFLAKLYVQWSWSPNHPIPTT